MEREKPLNVIYTFVLFLNPQNAQGGSRASCFISEDCKLVNSEMT